MQLPYKYIAIEGVIGAGKTSLANKLAKDLDAKLVLEEFSTNSFLEKFYQNPDRYAFSVEVGFLVERFQQIENDLKADLFTPYSVSDYLFDKSFIFARKNLGEDHYKIFKKLFQILSKSVRKPDILIYLYNTPQGLLNNIAKRGRKMEAKIEQDYLENLQNGYLQYFNYGLNYPVLMLDVSECDFLASELSYQKITSLLQNTYQNKLYKFKIA